MHKALVLFDIDGTLLLTGGATTRCVHRLAREMFGQRFREAPITAGKLDPQIFADVAADCGAAASAEQLTRYKQLYLADLEVELQREETEVVVMPGIRETIAALRRRRDVIVGLLTGNFRRGAELKLAAARLDWDDFPIGAFGEDGQRRCDLVGTALHRFERLSGRRQTPASVILIGDTPRDVSCAREAGCRVLAVATGRYRLDELVAENPDRAVADLLDRRPLEELIHETLNHHDAES